MGAMLKFPFHKSWKVVVFLNFAEKNYGIRWNWMISKSNSERNITRISPKKPIIKEKMIFFSVESYAIKESKVFPWPKWNDSHGNHIDSRFVRLCSFNIFFWVKLKLYKHSLHKSELWRFDQGFCGVYPTVTIFCLEWTLQMCSRHTSSKYDWQIQFWTQPLSRLWDDPVTIRKRIPATIHSNSQEVGGKWCDAHQLSCYCWWLKSGFHQLR